MSRKNRSWQLDVRQAFLLLNDASSEEWWDEIDFFYANVANFSEEEPEIALLALREQAPDGQVCRTAFHILSASDSSGRLLERGMMIALESEAASVLPDICRFAEKCPKVLSAELCEALEARLALKRDSWDRALFAMALRKLLKRCACANAQEKRP